MYWFEPDASIVESATCGCSRSKEISKIRKEGCCTSLDSKLEGGKEGPQTDLEGTTLQSQGDKKGCIPPK